MLPRNVNALMRGRSYDDPIDMMVRAIPPGTPLTPAAIIAELYDVGLWNLALINASMHLIMAKLAERTTHTRRVAE